MGPRGTEIDDSTPEDVAALYSWANLTGAKYRDYSAERRERRAQVRYRSAKELLQRELEAQAKTGAESAEAADLRVDSARRAEAAAHAALRAIEEQREIAEARESARRKQELFEQAEKLRRERSGPQPGGVGAVAQGPQQSVTVEGVKASASETAGLAGANAAAREAEGLAKRAAAAPVPSTRTPIRPAWLEGAAELPWLDEAATTVAPAIAFPSARTASSSTTLLDSREQVALRWPALQKLIGQLRAQAPGVAVRMSWSRGPVVAVVSPVGGAGKTSMAAALARALAKAGERVLLVETAAQGLLPLYLGMERIANAAVSDAATHEGEPGAVSLTRFELAGGTEREQEEAIETLLAKAEGRDRIILDLAPEAMRVVQRLTALRPMVLAVITPDMNSVAGLPEIEQTFASFTDRDGRALLPFYVLNQFDARLPLHLDIREVLGRQLGRRLADVTVRRSPAISEALAEGTPVLDYAPDAPVTRDLSELASWVASVAAASTDAIAASARGGR